jgi:hypothetical protein
MQGTIGMIKLVEAAVELAVLSASELPCEMRAKRCAIVQFSIDPELVALDHRQRRLGVRANFTRTA